jgi:hypothetical protein
MTMLRCLLAAAVLSTSLLVPAGSALASGADVLRDCNNNGHLTKTYTQKELHQALAQMPADLREYSDCANIIRQAELGLGGAGGGGGSNGSNPAASSQNPFAGATPQEITRAQTDIAKARRTGGVAQRVGTASATPGTLAYRQVKSVSKLPLPLLILVVLILLGAGGLASYLVHDRRGRSADPGA